MSELFREGDIIRHFKRDMVSDEAKAQNMYLSSLEFSQEKPVAEPLIYKIIK